ncbi:tyrosine-type recombinase/integrase [Roseateles oligotrophus]|nr:integrase arm-type DNA-binding domain-containing protein [Roseateles oligotrophus]
MFPGLLCSPTFPPMERAMLTNADCLNATCPPDLKRRRFTDGAGLYLEVSPNGAKRWFWKFYPDGKESRLALGRYPDVSLKAARLARDDARKTRQSGVNPVQKKMADKLASSTSSEATFEAVAREFQKKQAIGWSDAHASRWLSMCKRHLFGHIGSLPLDTITVPVLLATLQKVEAKGILSTAHDLREIAGQVFRYGAQTGKSKGNPAADLRGALQPITVTHRAAILDPMQAGDLLRAIDGYQGQPTTRAAMQLSALLFQRPGNVRAMEWTELDLGGEQTGEQVAGLWSIPAEKMKRTKTQKINGRPHLVPLARQAVEVLRALRPLTGDRRYVFPSLLKGDRCMSDNTINTALRRMGFEKEEMTSHGFRSMARTIMAERLSSVPHDVVEAQLAHGKSGPLGMAYDRADYMEQRKQMMQTWADYLDQLRAGAQIIQIKAA